MVAYKWFFKIRPQCNLEFFNYQQDNESFLLRASNDGLKATPKSTDIQLPYHQRSLLHIKILTA